MLITDGEDWDGREPMLHDLRRSGCGVLWLPTTAAPGLTGSAFAATYRWEPGDYLDGPHRLGEAMRDEIRHADSGQPPTSHDTHRADTHPADTADGADRSPDTRAESGLDNGTPDAAAGAAATDRQL